VWAALQRPLRLADRIIVLDQGRISEMGTYDELIEQAGGFFEMLKLQEDRD
jgi:ATP-binding cassette subfamily B protein